MKIETGTVFTHDDHDQVVVLSVQRVYDTFDTEMDEGTGDRVVVRWAYDWDAYGAVWGHTRTEQVDEFLSKIGDPIDEIDFIGPDG